MKKKGWIRIVEAFIAILLIAGVLLIVINKGYIGTKDISLKVYDAEISMLREIELNTELRKEILILSPLPVNWKSEKFPSSVKNLIINKKPNYLECEAKICDLIGICFLDTYIEEDVYSQAVAITASLEYYKPRQLKLFCWVK